MAAGGVKFAGMICFFRYMLRTTDAPAAREFYARVLGRDDAIIFPLHEQALANGARPHWLGFIGVDDLEATAGAFLARGATRPGAAVRMRDGFEYTMMRDPDGALLALANRSTVKSPLSEPEVAWHVLNTPDAARAAEVYRQLFGWHAGARLDGGAHGAFRELAWEEGGAAVGAIGDLAGRPGVHPHWLYFFRVAALDPAVAAVRAGGGVALEPFALPNGARAAVCDDPQGAAFALYASA